MIPCIIAHGFVNALSKFALDLGEDMLTEWIYMIATIAVAIILLHISYKAAE